MWELGVPSHEVTHKENHFVNKSLKHILLNEQPPHLHLCKGTLTCTSSTTPEVRALPPLVEKFLKEFGDVFPSGGPSGLPPFRVIEHQIDFVTREPVYPIGQHTEQILKKRRRLSPKFKS